MPLQAPNLDDRRFDDIVAEARALIPRYTPELTNLNASDPAVTVMELFAWMTDMLLYRLNQVPERNYVKFLQLLGIELEAARPAQAEVTFTLAQPDIASVIVPLGAQVSAPGGDDGQPVIFETDRALVAIGATLSAVQTFDGFAYTVQTTRNATGGAGFYPFGKNPKEGHALLLGFSAPGGFPAVQIDLAVSLGGDARTRPVVRCAGALPPPAALVWEYWNGAGWTGIPLDNDGTRAFSQDGHVQFPGPGANLVPAKIGNVKEGLCWLRVRVGTTDYETAPRVTAIRTNTVGVTQAVTLRDEVLGGSDGTPGQVFTLASTPVVAALATLPDGTQANVSTLRLEIDEGSGFAAWREVEDFLGAGPADAVYTLDRNTGKVTLGNGTHGRIAVANPLNPTANVVARTYRSGGTHRGNVGAGAITQLETYLPSVSAVTNPDAATGGTDEERVEDAKLRAPGALKSKERAVTAEDFQYLAQRAPGANVRRALALPLHHPDFPAGQVPGVVTVVVVPDSDANCPMPNRTTLQAVCQYLDAHRLLTTELYVVGPVYRKVRVEVRLAVEPGSDLAVVKNKVLRSLDAFFHPFTGGKDGAGWPFGGEIFYSDLYRIIFTTPGVARVQDNQLLVQLDDQPQPFCRDVAINAGELLCNDPRGHLVEVAYANAAP